MKRQDGKQLVFFFDGYPVGVFEGTDYPTVPGRYRYDPYRGPGHWRMQTAYREGLRPRCTFRTKERSISFCVENCPENHVLDLADFQEEPN
jgi:hypothetical protein